MIVDEKKGGWKRFQRLKFDSKNLSKRARRAETMTTKHARKFVLQRFKNIRDVRQHVTLWLFGVAVLIGAIGLQMLWYQEGYKTETAVSGGTYAEAVQGPIDTLNPLYARTEAEQSASRLIFSGLFNYDQTGHLRSDIATGYTIDPTKKIYTVTLRSGATWQDGAPLTADDVVFTVNLMKNPSARALMHSSWTDIMAEASSPTTVKFTLPAAYAAFPQALTFSILPKHVLSSIDPGSLRQNVFSLSPTGSGPFSFRLLQSVNASGTDKILYLNARKDFYLGAPKLARFELHVYADNAEIEKALQSHSVNAGITTNLKTNPLSGAFDSALYPINSGVYALFNMSSPLLKDTAIRKALQIGTDTDAVRKKIGDVPALDLPFIASQVEGVALPSKPAYDFEAAKKMLDTAGWKLVPGSDIRKNNSGQPLQLRLVATKDASYHDILSALKDQWQKLGIDVQVAEFDTSQAGQSFAKAILQPRAYDVLVNKLAIGADPDVFAYWHSSQANPSGLNFSNYQNGLVDDALLSARLRDESNLRAYKYQTFAAQWLGDAPAIGLYQSVIRYTHTSQSSALTQQVILPSASDRYENVLYWTADRNQVYKTP